MPDTFDLTVRRSLEASLAFLGPCPFQMHYRAALAELATPPDRHRLNVMQQSLVSNLLRVEHGQDLGPHLSLEHLEDALAGIRERVKHGWANLPRSSA